MEESVEPGKQSTKKHAAPSVEHAIECFDGVSSKDISKVINKMGQRELQVFYFPWLAERSRFALTRTVLERDPTD